MKRSLDALQERLGVRFHNVELLRQALVHRSYLNEHRDFSLDHNERLEFLGDAVLEMIVTEHLYQHYPNPEGELTNWRASLVNAMMLAMVAEQLGVGEEMYLSRGEARDQSSKARQSILANAMEAMIGAMFLDSDYDTVATFIHKHIICKLPHILKHRLYMDPKSRFQETAQERIGITPHYVVLEESGPDHRRHFVIGVYLDSDQVSTGEGDSKQAAQMQAAERALSIKGWE